MTFRGLERRDTLRFAEMTGICAMIEPYPLAKAAEGHARMMSGKAQFRVPEPVPPFMDTVLTM